MVFDVVLTLMCHGKGGKEQIKLVWGDLMELTSD